MNHWLVKTEPNDYSARDLERDGSTEWDGVRNNAALKHLRAMAPDDTVLIYHTGKEKAAVAVAKVVSEPRPDDGDESGKLAVVDVRFGRWLEQPVRLADVKADPFFADFALVRLSRLSVMPVSHKQWRRLLEMAGDATAGR